MAWMKRACLLALLLVVAACTSRDDPFAFDARQYHREVEQWRVQRLAELRSPGGWLSYVGSGRLKPGAYNLGHAADNTLWLPVGPDYLGRLTVNAAGGVIIEARPGVGVTLDGKPLQGAVALTPAGNGVDASRLQFGSGEFYLVRVGNVLGWRCRDANAPRRREFRGIEHFPVDAQWRVIARWKPLAPPGHATLLSSIGTPLPALVTGEAEFEMQGRSYRLQAMQDASEPLSSNLFFIFTDLTSGRETYGGARYLDASAPHDGKVLLDFNRARNPPCALSPHVVCPIAPAINRLELRVNAGEKYQFLPR